MIYVSGIDDAQRLITTYMMTHAGALPVELRDLVIGTVSSPSPVDKICQTAELLWARRADVGAAGLELCGQLAQFGATWGWHSLGGGRGDLIVGAVRRELEEEGATQDPESDPEPLREWMVQE